MMVNRKTCRRSVRLLNVDNNRIYITGNMYVLYPEGLYQYNAPSSYYLSCLESREEYEEYLDGRFPARKYPAASLSPVYEFLRCAKKIRTIADTRTM